MEHISLTRKELYELVWKESMLSLSKRFQISDVGLRKLCKRMEIPVPQAGYWAKVQHGKKVKRFPLPSTYKGEETAKLSLRPEGVDNKEQKERSERKQKVQELEANYGELLKVPDSLERPDPIVREAKSVLSKQKPSTWDYIGTVSSWQNTIDIRVAKENVDRALHFLDTWVKAMRKRGHDFATKESRIEVLVNGQSYRIALREKNRREVVQERYGPRHTFYPNGILSFQVGRYSPKEFKDGIQKLEEQLPKIIAYLESLAEEDNRRDFEFQRQEAERREQERVRKEFEASREQELLRFQKLISDSERWHKADNLRRYLEEFEARASVNNDPIPTEVAEWLAWARAKADWYDPFTEKQDELFEEVDRNTLTVLQKARYYW